MVIIEIQTGSDKASIQILDLHLAAIRNTEHFIVAAGNKADASIFRRTIMLPAVGTLGIFKLLQRTQSNLHHYIPLKADLLHRQNPGTGKGLANRAVQHILIGNQSRIFSCTGGLIKGLIGKAPPLRRLLQVQVGFVIYQIKGFFLFRNHRALPPFSFARLVANSKLKFAFPFSSVERTTVAL